MRVVLVCGGRDFRDREMLGRALAKHIGVRQPGGPVLKVVMGCAPGADEMAYDWGWRSGHSVTRYWADWNGLGKRAGPIRNQKMLDEEKPDFCLAFPGGRGTADMVRRAKAAKVPGVRVRR